VVDVFIEEVGRAPGELEEERDCLLLLDVAVLLEVVFEVAEWGRSYPPEQNSRKK
jgi:hypothetical protein